MVRRSMIRGCLVRNQGGSMIDVARGRGQTEEERRVTDLRTSEGTPRPKHCQGRCSRSRQRFILAVVAVARRYRCTWKSGRTDVLADGYRISRCVQSLGLLA